MRIIVAAAADRPAAHRRRRRRADTTTGRSDTKYQAPTGRSSGGSRSIPVVCTEHAGVWIHLRPWHGDLAPERSRQHGNHIALVRV
jgi:hypothetical protein